MAETVKKAGRKVAEEMSPRRVRRFFAELGPGLITGRLTTIPQESRPTQ